MEEYTIDTGKDPDEHCPLAFIESLCSGRGGIIRIEPGSHPPRILWTLKTIVMMLCVGYQWATIGKLLSQGMHKEHAEHHTNSMLNDLIKIEVLPLPTQRELEIIKKQYAEHHEKREQD